MLKLRSTKLMCLLIAFIWTTVIIGSSYAYFIDSVQVNGNIVTTGNLKAEMQWSDDMKTWHDVVDPDDSEDYAADAIFSGDRWEPNYTEVKYIKIKNAGSLAFQYRLDILPTLSETNPGYKLGEVIEAYVDVVDGNYVAPNGYKDFEKMGKTPSGTIASMITSDTGAYYGTLLKADETITLAVALHMQHTAGNEYQGLSVGDGFNLRLYATQTPFEYDSFGNTYDESADSAMPKNEFAGGSASGTVSVVDGVTTTAVNLSGGAVQAYVPAGVKVNDGVTKLTLSVTVLEESQNGIKAGKGESLLAVDVHVDGLSADNTVPLKITLSKALASGLNVGNTELYHVENGKKLAMTQVMSDAELAAHNQYYYNPVDGTLTLNMATFSEVAALADTVAKWEGTYDYSWYDASKTELTIANADQLAGFGAIVGGMNGQTRDSFNGQTVKLIADVDLNDKSEDGKIFYPIGYYNSTGSYEKKSGGSVTSSVSSFEGTFDGNGHTISNFYQNTWEMFGDYNDGYSGTPNHYKDAMGLFGYVVNGTVKNLTVDNFSSDGEFTPTGVIAAYAVNSTFENIAITNCNPRVYNTGNGGIIGIAGNSNDQGTQITLRNITVDNSNKITALWGSWDVACGGLVGMFRGNADGGTGKIHFENCHVAAQIDVYNDVCGNYQYYAYRYAGMMIGSVRHNKTENGHSYPNMAGITAKGCTVHFDTWNDYFYCELKANSQASYTHDHQFSRLTEVKDINGTTITYLDGSSGTVPATGRYNYVVVKGEFATQNATCYHFVDGEIWNHTDAGKETVNGVEIDVEDHAHIYLPFSQLFTGYGWGVTSKGLSDYAGIETMDITYREETALIDKFEKNTSLSGDFLYRVGNGNAFPIGKLFQEVSEDIAVVDSGVHVSVKSLVEGVQMVGTFVKNESDWTKSTLHITGGTGPAKLVIQDYNNCKPFELIVEVVDAINLTSATGTTSGGNFVLLCDVNTSDYVYYWNSTLYGNGFTYSLYGAPNKYSSSHGHGVLMTKNAMLDNLVIIGDVYSGYGAYTNQDYYNAAVDVVGDTIIQNCYIANCAAPVSTRANATITNTTLYGGAVANLIIKGGTVTLENVTTANYDDGRYDKGKPIGMGIVVHSDASEDSKLVLNGTLTQYNFVCEANEPSNAYAKATYSIMFGDECSKYQFGTKPNRYVNAGIVSTTPTFNASDIDDNANTAYVGTAVAVEGENRYVYTQLNTKGKVNNDSPAYVATTQGPIAPKFSFDYTTKNYVAKIDGNNDYCYEENGIVYISMDESDTFDWDTSILTVDKTGKNLTYTVSMNGTDYTGKSIEFNTAGDYEVLYTYTDPNNYKLDENGNITTYSETYTKTVKISVAVVKATTKHAKFTFGSSGTASTSVTIGNNTYVMPNVTGTSSTVGSITVSGNTVYYPIVDAYTSDGKTAHGSLNSWYMCYPVFKNVVTITDYADAGTGNAETFGSSTTTMPAGLNLTAYSQYFAQTNSPSGAVIFTTGKADTAFKYQASNSAPANPATLNNTLIFKSPTLSNNARKELWLLVQYNYNDNAGATYYYYVGYHMPETTVSGGGCVTTDTLITLADGSKKEIQHVTYEDQLLVWDFYKGEYVVAPAAIISNHGLGENTVIALEFSDGTVVKAVNEHAFVDLTLNDMVVINAENAESFIGHSFAKTADNGYQAVELVGCKVTTEMVEAWGVLTAGYFNCITEDMISFAGSAEELASVDYFEYGDSLKYDEEAMQADLEKYGEYTYDEFADLVTPEQFEALGIAKMKISVGKGKTTYDYILHMIDTYLK